MSSFVDIDHPRFRRVERAIFLRRVVADCMSHECRLRKEGDRTKLDACCQYGVDVDVGERDQILARAEQIRSVLSPEVRDLAWFQGDEQVDGDFPSGRFVRTATFGDGCLFLHHDGRGCAIHRASIEGDWDFHGIKPNVCRLFPLSYDDCSILMSDDYPDYSCAGVAGEPTVYRVGRDALAAIFGAALVTALDRAEAAVLADEAAARPAGLRVVADTAPVD